MTVLLDGPLLAALVITEHEHHERAGRWLARQDSFAICPISEAALLRFLLRLGETPTTGLAVLAAISKHPKCQSWPADLAVSSIDASDITSADELDQAYLAAVARAHGGELATVETISA